MTGPGTLRAVIRFNRDVEFPNFDMKTGERWGFQARGNLVDRLERIKAGKRFEFAGGQCLARDVELVYEGRSGRKYSAAMGTTEPATL